MQLPVAALSTAYSASSLHHYAVAAVAASGLVYSQRHCERQHQSSVAAALVAVAEK